LFEALLIFAELKGYDRPSVTSNRLYQRMKIKFRVRKRLSNN